MRHYERLSRVPLESKYTDSGLTQYRSTDNDEIKSASYDDQLIWTKEEEDTVRKKIDRKLLPFVLLMMFVLHMDRTNLSNAISDNLAADLGFDMDGINVGVMDYTGFLILRVLIAVTEAGFSPACLFYMTLWYKSNELPSRLAYLWGIQNVASAFSGLMSFAVFRMRGICGLEGWKWLFLIDGIATHIVGLIILFYLPASPSEASGWFDERQTRIAMARIIRDDKSKIDQHKQITWNDCKLTVMDMRLWLHLFAVFIWVIPIIPLYNYLPSMIKSAGFSTTDANILTIPPFVITLVGSIMVARSSERHGEIALHTLAATAWSLIGYIILEFLPDTVSGWGFYFAVLVAASAPSTYGIQVAWMSANLAPVGKRTLALGAVIGAANISGVFGSQIYKAYDAPRFHNGNWINIGLRVAAILLYLAQRMWYVSTNEWRRRQWRHMSDEQRQHYLLTTDDVGSDSLDFRFKL
ncbi:hypothetical protein DFQ28_010272 [Apophysomyces sp. BC1034]|nr:hypothetical protein DFQ30_009889 [Apophysomyces sp. BC1015]KAG0171567.1 hypothetical protein DFQ29_008777 [Apophysomyces sp. BC1021]KAG0184902.1 hypothetical protein DFQ28_010272 [Apophysomyces sp. BC1034]